VLVCVYSSSSQNQNHQQGSCLVGVPSVNPQSWRFTNNSLGVPYTHYLSFCDSHTFHTHSTYISHTFHTHYLSFCDTHTFHAHFTHISHIFHTHSTHISHTIHTHFTHVSDTHYLSFCDTHTFHTYFTHISHTYHILLVILRHTHISHAFQDMVVKTRRRQGAGVSLRWA